MDTRQTETRTEWRVSIRTSLGTVRSEYRLTKESAEELRAKHDVIEITEVTRTLDF